MIELFQVLIITGEICIVFVTEAVWNLPFLAHSGEFLLFLVDFYFYNSFYFVSGSLTLNFGGVYFMY